MRDLDLVTVCEDAGCPNLSECWTDGTATFMVLGERCTRACGFCLVDTRKPSAPSTGRAGTRRRGGRRGWAWTTPCSRWWPATTSTTAGWPTSRRASRRSAPARPGTRVETLISDVKGDAAALDVLLDVRPDVLNHNVETVARLQRAVRPSAGYARSLSVLARAKAAGLVTKSGFMVGLGETDDEIDGVLADLAAIGVDIVTIGQYLRPTSNHLPVARWVEPAELRRSGRPVGELLGIGHVEASPLTRSSYHARAAASHAAATLTGSMISTSEIERARSISRPRIV